jgi:hypothetical protein
MKREVTKEREQKNEVREADEKSEKNVISENVAKDVINVKCDIRRRI